jgi:hypothetical protein
MRSLHRLPVLFFLISAACHGGRAGNAEPVDQTRARIENRTSFDMDIFVRRNDGRATRLGFAPGNETTTFALPPSLTAGAVWVRFEAKPVRGGGQPQLSEPFPIKMGDEISWSVPPQ